MTRSRSFSIYLLKLGFDATNALEDDHPLEEDFEATSLPAGATLYVLDAAPRPPWWRGYFGIQEELTQVTKGALVFLPTGGRCFALSFGHVSHNLCEESFEYDFGLRVTLNCLDPGKLKSTDTLDPGAAKRRRTQLPTESELTLFDFDRDSTILRRLTGKVKDEHKELFRHATGGANLRISTDIGPGQLDALSAKLLALYLSEDYKTAFPDIQNLVPVRDPAQLEALSDRLIDAFRARDPALNITVPELVNYQDNVFVAFSGAGSSLVYDDVYIGRYYHYLDASSVDLDDMEIDDLRRHALVLTDEDGHGQDRFSIFKSLLFDTALPGAAGETFHLCEGEWYKVDDNYIARLTAYLDPRCGVSHLPAYAHANEGEYNTAAAAAVGWVCLDRTSIAPAGQAGVEPCDILVEQDELATFCHIKVSTLSAQLSHLFNQGANAIGRVPGSGVAEAEQAAREARF
jgi:uncharacterized protein (TIGR04141 family)